MRIPHSPTSAEREPCRSRQRLAPRRVRALFAAVVAAGLAGGGALATVAGPAFASSATASRSRQPMSARPGTKLAPRTNVPAAPASVSAPGRAAAPKSGSALLSSARAAVGKEAGVLETVSERSGSSSATIKARIGKSEGDETGTFVDGKQHGTARIIAIGKTAYLRGDTFGLTASGLTPAAAKAEANRWLSMPASKGLGASLSSGLSMKTTASGIGLGGTLRVSPVKTLDGQRVIAVSTSSSGETASIYIRSTGKPLPVELRASAGSTFSETVTFADWGSAPSVTAPRPAVPLKTSWVSSKS